MPAATTNGSDWHQRARRAEAEAVARAHRRRSPRCSTRTPRRRELERELAEVTESTSWRLTKPLRRLNAARRARRAR